MQQRAILAICVAARGTSPRLPSAVTKPVKKSTYSPVGTPFFIITRTTLWPVRSARFHEPWNTANASPTYSAGKAERPEFAV